MIRRLFRPIADLTAAAFVFVVSTGHVILSRLPDMARTDAAWLGCRKASGWGVDVRCGPGVTGWLMETLTESADTLIRLPLLLVNPAPRPLSGNLLLGAVAGLEAALLLWFFRRFAQVVVRLMTAARR